MAKAKILPDEVNEYFVYKGSSSRLRFPDGQEVDFSRISLAEARQLARHYPDLLAAKPTRTTPKKKGT